MTITKKPNKTDAGNGSKAFCRVSNVLRSPSPDPGRSAKRQSPSPHMFSFFKKEFDPTASCMKARDLVAQGRVDEAINLLNDVITRCPEFALAFADRGTVHAMTEQYSKAVEDLTTAQSLGYREGSLFTTLASVQAEMGELEGSLKTFAQAEAVEPNNPFIYYNRASVYISLGRKGSAIADLNKCLEFGPDENSRKEITRLVEEANKLPDSES